MAGDNTPTDRIEHAENPNHLNRRSILKGIGAGGIGLLGLPPAAAERPNATVEIDQVKTRGPDGNEKVVSTRDVPRRWYNQMIRARRVNERLQDRFIHVDGVISVGIAALDERVAGKPRHGIKIRIEGNSISPSVPSAAEGVPVIVERNVSRGVLQTHATCAPKPTHYANSYDPLLAGVLVEPTYDTLQGSDCGNFGTICCRVNKNQSNDYILTARHLWGCGATDDEIINKEVYQHGDFIGTISDVYMEHDAVLVNLSSNRSASLGVVDDPNGYSLFGYVTENEMGWLLNTTVQKRGVGSGKGTATPTDYGVMSDQCRIFDDQVIYDTWYASGGDSGGPYFYDAGNGDYHLLGMHSWAEGSSPKTSGGVAGYALANKQSIWPAF